jgi:hypothetical protein
VGASSVTLEIELPIKVQADRWNHGGRWVEHSMQTIDGIVASSRAVSEMSGLRRSEKTVLELLVRRFVPFERQRAAGIHPWDYGLNLHAGRRYRFFGRDRTLLP